MCEMRNQTYMNSEEIRTSYEVQNLNIKYNCTPQSMNFSSTEYWSG